MKMVGKGCLFLLLTNVNIRIGSVYVFFPKFGPRYLAVLCHLIKIKYQQL